MSALEELDAWLEEHKPPPKPPRGPKEPTVYRCSCGMESTNIADCNGHAWKGHLFHQVNQKPWSAS